MRAEGGESNQDTFQVCERDIEIMVLAILRRRAADGSWAPWSILKCRTDGASRLAGRWTYLNLECGRHCLLLWRVYIRTQT